MLQSPWPNSFSKVKWEVNRYNVFIPAKRPRNDKTRKSLFNKTILSPGKGGDASKKAILWADRLVHICTKPLHCEAVNSSFSWRFLWYSPMDSHQENKKAIDWTYHDRDSFWQDTPWSYRKKKKNLVLICATYHQVRAWSPYPVPWCRRWHWSKYTMERNGTVGQHTHCSQLQTLSTQTMWTRSDPPSLSPTRSYKTTYSSPCHMATSKKLSIFKMLEPRAWCFYVFPVSRFPLWNKRSI